MRLGFFITALLLSALLCAEEGEFQAAVGAGGLIPLSSPLDSTDIEQRASWNVALNLFFGLTDNLDIGIQPSFTNIADSYRGREFNGFYGREYFDLRRLQILVMLRYNLYAGGFFSPHLMIGGGIKTEIFSNREFIVDIGKITDFDGGEYAKVSPAAAGGFDLQFRVWEWITLSAQLLYKWSPHDHSFDLLGFFGASFFINYYR